MNVINLFSSQVSSDDLQEKIESFESHVQSTDIAAFNKV